MATTVKAVTMAIRSPSTARPSGESRSNPGLSSSAAFLSSAIFYHSLVWSIALPYVPVAPDVNQKLTTFAPLWCIGLREIHMEPELTLRKTVTLPIVIWDAIKAYQDREFIGAEAEAIRRLMVSALRAARLMEGER